MIMMFPVISLIQRRAGSWDPFRDLFRTHEGIDRVFSSFWDQDRDLALTGPWVPSVEVYEDKDRVTVKAELPGVTQDDLSVNVTEDTLTISGERKNKREDNEGSTLFSETIYGNFHRAIPLKQAVKLDETKAVFKDGILEVTLPKAEESKSREIKIEIK